MSCGSRLKQVAGTAARRVGIPAEVSRKAFLVGAAAAGTLLAGVLLARKSSGRTPPPVPDRPVATLAGEKISSRPASAQSSRGRQSKPGRGRKTNLRPRWVKVGAIENVEGYGVWAGGEDTGLSLVPEVKLAGEGQSRVNKARWFVSFNRANMLVAGPYGSVNEAKGAASLLARFNWNRAVEDFSDLEIRGITRTVNEYRQKLQLRRQCMHGINKYTFSSE